MVCKPEVAHKCRCQIQFLPFVRQRASQAEPDPGGLSASNEKLAEKRVEAVPVPALCTTIW